MQKTLLAFSFLPIMFSLQAADNAFYLPGADISSNQTTLYVAPLDDLNTTPLFEIPGYATSIVMTPDRTTAYISANSNIYKIQNFSSGNNPSITPVLNITDSYNSLALTSDNLHAYTTTTVANGGSGQVYYIDLSTGTRTPIGPSNANGYYGITLSPDNQIAYVAGGGGNQLDHVYKFILSPFSSTQVDNTTDFYYGVSLSPDQNTLYVSTSISNGNIYSFNLSSLPATRSNDLCNEDGSYGPMLISDEGQTLYVALTPGNNIYQITIPASGSNPRIALLENPSSSLLLSALALGYYSLAPPIPSQISLAGLKGQNKKLAKYLNTYAPSSTVELVAALSGNALNQALTAIAPTRNAYSSFLSQLATLSLGQLASDHLRTKRFDTIACLPKTSANCKANPPYSTWLSTFGEYMHEKGGSQLPSFGATLWGAIGGFDYNGTNSNVLGVAVAYAHTHLYEANGAGHADLNQGYLTGYGTINLSSWYIDTAVWGGYSHTKNLRRITFPQFRGRALSSTHGWQFNPHLEFGYDGFWLNQGCVARFGLEPFVMADLVNSWEHSFQETGAPGFNMGQKGKYSSLLRAETGLRFHESANLSWGQLLFIEKGSYAYQKPCSTEITSFLVGSRGSLTTAPLIRGQNLGIVEFMTQFTPCHPQIPYVNFSYQGEFGSKYQSHQGQFTCGKNF